MAFYGRYAYFVQQDTVFWKRSLWEKSHPVISSFRLAGDYALWVSFAKIAPLWSFNRRVSMFRKRPGQLSTNMKEYRREQEIIAPSGLFQLTNFFGLDSNNFFARKLFFIFLLFSKEPPYIDFDANGNAIKKESKSYFARPPKQSLIKLLIYYIIAFRYA